jgi:predicted kinase
MVQNKLLLIRGLPGSGKSTLAASLTGYVHVETDQYFTWGGVYNFDSKCLKSAHEWCQIKAKYFLKIGKSVVVSNTFTQQWELDPYLNIAKELKIPVSIVLMQNQFQNTHNVPEETLKRMKERFQYDVTSI